MDKFSSKQKSSFGPPTLISYDGKDTIKRISTFLCFPSFHALSGFPPPLFICFFSPLPYSSPLPFCSLPFCSLPITPQSSLFTHKWQTISSNMLSAHTLRAEGEFKINSFFFQIFHWPYCPFIHLIIWTNPNPKLPLLWIFYFYENKTYISNLVSNTLFHFLLFFFFSFPNKVC